VFFDEVSTFRDRLRDDSELFDLLMQRRVRNILFVAPLYDAYILQQESNLAEQILNEYKQLNLSTVPKVVTVPTGRRALEMLDARPFELVLTAPRIGDMDPIRLAETIAGRTGSPPVIMLLNSEADVPLAGSTGWRQHLADAFLYTGDSKLFLAILKSVEDRLNVDSDVKEGFVRVILLVEDDIRYYSRFLPLLYSEIVKQTQRVIGDEYTLGQKTLRMRARPKVLMAHTYEDAVFLYERYRDALLCLISDVRYPCGGELDGAAGFKLVELVRRDQPTLPVVLQSTNPGHYGKAQYQGVTFLHKHSDTLERGLKDFLLDNCGFGDFVFRSRDGLPIDRATSIADLATKLQSVPLESVTYHSGHNHFSAWLMAHGEIQLARRLRPISAEDFSSPRALREYLTTLFQDLRRDRTLGKIVDFQPKTGMVDGAIMRLASGSLGGKGRGLAFLNAFVATSRHQREKQPVRVRVPRTAIIGTDEFDAFLDSNPLPDLASRSDDEIRHAFVGGRLSPGMRGHLACLLETMTAPLAVRSSSLLEDSQSRPFAGVYDTFMLPNDDPDPRVRLDQLCTAIRLVFSSVFLSKAKSYIESIQYGVEQEKMAVVLQEIAGFRRGEYFYPDIAGVAESFDFYPPPGLSQRDGVATICLGLGKHVVDGGVGVRFCPRNPTHTTRLADEMPARSQKEFLAIALGQPYVLLKADEDVTLTTLSLRDAEVHGSLSAVASTWDVERGELVPGTYGAGPRVVTFEDILANTSFPLARLLDEFLQFGELALGVPVQLEFAVTLHDRTFHLLQIRPLARFTGALTIVPDELDRAKLVLQSDQAMGHGRIDDVTDILFVPPETFDSMRTHEMKDAIAAMNQVCRQDERHYVLMGPGRWGTRDRFLGIPVAWGDITQVKSIVEIGMAGFPVEPSQGSHFFHNLVAMNMGYFTIDLAAERGFIDRSWLDGLEVIQRTPYVVHLRAPSSVTILMDGAHHLAVIEKPA